MDQSLEPSQSEVDDANTCSADYFCELCGHYPLIPVHGHFECPQCHYKTKCCEGMALDA